MSMLKNTLAAITKSLARPSAEYATARSRCAPLAPYETPDAVVAALRDAGALTLPRRDALAAAILAEHQRAPLPLWQSILLAAFEPVLTRYRRKLGPPDDEDVDQQILLAFLEAARTVHGAAHTTLALRWLTQAKVKSAVKRDRRERKHAQLDEETYEAPFGGGAPAKLAADDVMRVIEKRGGEELLRAVLATEVEEDTLDAYVARAYATSSPADRATLYTRLRLAKARVLAELRARSDRDAALAA
jgi:hypothetical protein